MRGRNMEVIDVRLCSVKRIVMADLVQVVHDVHGRSYPHLPKIAQWENRCGRRFGHSAEKEGGRTIDGLPGLPGPRRLYDLDQRMPPMSGRFPKLAGDTHHIQFA